MTQKEADNLSTGDLITITYRVDQCNDGAYNAILIGQRTRVGWSYEVYTCEGKIKRVTCEQIVRLVNSY